MLADLPKSLDGGGKLGDDVQAPHDFIESLITFVADQLPLWRMDPDRPAVDSESELTEHLCDYLSGACRKSSWDDIQFRTEVRDEAQAGRSVDLAPKPCGCALVIGPRRYSKYEKLFPIECKSFPTPNGGKQRDEREYVYSGISTTGGIQRFKAGHHGATHTFGAMIGYIQDKTSSHWYAEVCKWIDNLAAGGVIGWSASDRLNQRRCVLPQGVTMFDSTHVRATPLENISLRHMWLLMK